MAALHTHSVRWIEMRWRLPKIGETIGAAIIVGLFSLIAAFIQRPSASPSRPDEPRQPHTAQKPVEASLRLVGYRPHTQSVNEKSNPRPPGTPPDWDLIGGRPKFENTEWATFELQFLNSSARPVTVDTGVLYIDTVTPYEYTQSTKMITSPINHSGHFPVWLNGVRPGEVVHFPIYKSFLAGPSSMTVWFKSTDTPKCGFVLIEGKIAVTFEGKESNRRSVRILIHSDSAEMHYGRLGGA